MPLDAPGSRRSLWLWEHQLIAVERSEVINNTGVEKANFAGYSSRVLRFCGNSVDTSDVYEQEDVGCSEQRKQLG